MFTRLRFACDFKLVSIAGAYFQEAEPARAPKLSKHNMLWLHTRPMIETSQREAFCDAP